MGHKGLPHAHPADAPVVPLHAGAAPANQAATGTDDDRGMFANFSKRRRFSFF